MLNKVKNITILKTKMIDNREYIKVFSKYLKTIETYNYKYFDTLKYSFFPNTALTLLYNMPLFSYNTVYPKKNIKTFFGVRDGSIEKTMLYTLEPFGIRPYTRFPFMRVMQTYEDHYYHTENLFKLSNFLYKLRRSRRNSRVRNLYATPGPSFSFAQKVNKNPYFQPKKRIVIDDTYTPIISPFYKRESNYGSLRIKQQYKGLRAYLKQFLSLGLFINKLLHNSDVTFSSRYSSLFRFFFTSMEKGLSVKSLNIFRYFFIKNIELEKHENIFSFYKIFYNFIKYRKYFKRKYKLYFKFFPGGLRPKFKKRNYHFFSTRSKPKTGLKKKLIFTKIYARLLHEYMNKFSLKKKKIMSLFLSKSDNPPILNSFFNEEDSNSKILPFDIIFNNGIPQQNKQNLIVEASHHNVKTELNAFHLGTPTIVSSSSRVHDLHLNFLETRSILSFKNIKNYNVKSLHAQLLDLIMSRFNPMYNRIHKYSNLSDFITLLIKNNIAEYSSLLPLNLHRVFLNSMKKLHFRNNDVKKYPIIFHHWSSRFLNYTYPNYKIVIQPYKFKRGSVQINVLSEHNNNLFSSWPGLLLKKPEEVVGEHQEYKYIYLRFLKRKNAKKDYNAKLLAARHVSNFMYTFLRKKPGSIEVVLKRPIDSMTKTLVNAVVPTYFWKNSKPIQFTKKIQKIKKKIEFPTVQTILNSFYSVKGFLLESSFFKYIFLSFLKKLKKTRLKIITNLSLDVLFKDDFLLFDALKMEIRYLLVFFIFFFKIRKSKQFYSTLVKSFKFMSKLNFKKIKYSKIERMLKTQRVNKYNRIFVRKILKKFYKCKNTLFDLTDPETNHIKNYYKIFNKLKKTSFSRLGRFVFYRKFIIAPKITHGVMTKLRKNRRV